MWAIAVLLVAKCCQLINAEAAVNMEEQLRKELFTNRKLDVHARPGRHHNQTINLNIGVTIHYLHALEDNTLKTTIWLNLEYINRDLAWNSKDYGDLNRLNVRPSKIWTPEVTLLNSAVKVFSSLLHVTNAVVRNVGGVTLIAPMTTHSYCPIDVRNFPFDSHECSLVFGSWTQDGSHIDVNVQDAEADTSTFDHLSSEFQLTGSDAQRVTYSNNCCKETYSAVIFHFRLRRYSAMYQVAILLPATLTAILSAGIFWVNPRTGQRLILAGCNLVANLILITHVSLTVPAATSGTPNIILLCVHGLCFSCLALLLSIGAITLSSRRPSSSPPNALTQLTSGNIGRILYISKDQVENGWMPLVTLIDRVSFIIYILALITIFIMYLH